ncbi:energy-coupling factor transporter ATPase [Sporolactobacillus sp. THM7-4]|nr:energy-coupling factor transporter ATPase [Sporolactobacillus sp. THM7-4]
MKSDQALIQLNDVSFHYIVEKKKELSVLHHISLNIFPGEYVAIIGHNGSGKSTLSKLFNGILKPSAGDVVVNGWNTKNSQLIRDIRQQVGIVFQNPDNQLIATTVEDDVAFGLENILVPAEEMESRINQALRTVGLTGMNKRAPHHLSGGQKQRLAIAGIIAMKPKCIIFDEATSMLDTYGRKEIVKVMRRLNNDGVALVTVTHYMSEVVEADRVIVIEKGKIITQGTPREVFRQKQLLQSIGLDVPIANHVAEMVHQKYQPFSSNLIDAGEVVEEVKHFTTGGVSV